MKLECGRPCVLATVGALWILLNAANAASPLNPASNPVYITHVTVIDTRTGKEAQGRTVVISGDRIQEVSESKGVKPRVGGKIVDGAGRYLIPGLWDMHVHVTRFASTYPLYLANGVTGVRDMSGHPDANKFRAELAAKNIDAPHIYLSSPIFEGPPPRAWLEWIMVSTPDEARKAVDEQKLKGADFIKILNRLSREVYFAIIDESRRQNIPVAGHVPFSITAWEAAAAHQRTFEHLYGIPLACSSREEELWAKWVVAASTAERLRLISEGVHSYSNRKCERLFAHLIRNGVWQVPTLVIIRDFGLLEDPQFPQEDRSRYFGRELKGWFTLNDDFRFRKLTAEDFAVFRELYLYDQKVLSAMFRAGVPILAGTDTVTPYCVPGFCLHEELALMVESGVTPLGVLQAATWNAARFMGSSDKYGAVAPGKIADLVLLDADPLVDIHNTTKVSAVFLAGKYFDRTALDQMLKDAEVAAADSVK